MVRRQHPQPSLFELLLPGGESFGTRPCGASMRYWRNEELIDQVEEALSRWRPKSRVRGRPGTPAAVVLRLLVLKHLYGWSFEECEREVRESLIYRAFCRIDCERVPDAKTLIRLAQALGPEVLKAMLERWVSLARQRTVVRDGLISANPGSGGRCAGVRAAKAASAPSSAGTGSPAVVTEGHKAWTAGWDWEAWPTICCC